MEAGDLGRGESFICFFLLLTPLPSKWILLKMTLKEINTLVVQRESKCGSTTNYGSELYKQVHRRPYNGKKNKQACDYIDVK